MMNNFKKSNNQCDINFKIYNEHKHDGQIINVSKEEIKTIQDLDKLAITLIEKNITQPLQFHIDNLKNNNILYTQFKIKNLLQLVRESDIPPDYAIFADISKILIKYDKTNEVPFCLSKGDFVNLRYKNRLKRHYQLKVASSCDDFFRCHIQINPKRMVSTI